MSRLHTDRPYRDPRAPPRPTLRSTVATTALFVGVLVLASWPLATVAGLTLALATWWTVRRVGWPSLGGRGPAARDPSDRSARGVAGEAGAGPR